MDPRRFQDAATHSQSVLMYNSCTMNFLQECTPLQKIKSGMAKKHITIEVAAIVGNLILVTENT